MNSCPKRRATSRTKNRAVPLEEGQTVSQPSMIAIMLAELKLEPTQRALEVGAGSGYAGCGAGPARG